MLIGNALAGMETKLSSIILALFSLITKRWFRHANIDMLL